MFEIFITFKSDSRDPLYFDSSDVWSIRRLTTFIFDHFDEFEDFQVFNVGDKDGNNSSQ